LKKPLKLRNIFIELLMQLSVTLRNPLDQYVDDYFGSKVKDLATAFNLLETEVIHVLEFGNRQIKRAPSRRSSSRESETPIEPVLEPALPEPVPAKPVPKEPLPSKKSTVEKCSHPIKGPNPRICEKGAKHNLDDKWYCKPHLKIYMKKPRDKVVGEEKNIAKKIWKKKILEKKFNFIEEDGYYFDSRTRICVSPNSKEAYGILPKDGGPIQPLQEDHLELLTAANFKYRETPTQLDELLSESDSEDLVLLSSDGDND